MATSSIFSNVTIKDKDGTERFVKALERASSMPTRVSTSDVNPPLRDHREIKVLFEKGLADK